MLDGPAHLSQLERAAEAPAAAEVVLEDRAVQSGRVEDLAVRAEVGAEDAPGVPREALERLARSRIPDDCNAIVSRADGGSRVG